MEITIAGPALAAAAWPVRTKIPVPMIAPTPSVVSCPGPRTRFSVASPWPDCSRSICSMDFVAKMDMPKTVADPDRRSIERSFKRCEEELKFLLRPSPDAGSCRSRAICSRREGGHSMRVPSSRIFAILSLAFLGLTPAAAHADPILVTGGLVGLLGPGAEPASAQLFGDGLRLSGDGHGGATGPLELQPGEVGRVHGSFNFSAPHPFNVTVDGAQYVAFLIGGLEFTSSSFALPTPTFLPGSGTGALEYQVPFTMTGRVQGFTQ